MRARSPAILSLLAAASLVAGVSTSFAADPVVLRPGFAKLQKIGKPIQTAIVGNPEVADVTVQGGTSIVISAKSVGETNVLLLDNEDNVIYAADVLVSKSATAAQQ